MTWMTEGFVQTVFDFRSTVLVATFVTWLAAEIADCRNALPVIVLLTAFVVAAGAAAAVAVDAGVPSTEPITAARPDVLARIGKPMIETTATLDNLTGMMPPPQRIAQISDSPTGPSFQRPFTFGQERQFIVEIQR
ncbi:MAG: hypothetical protein PSY12_12570 [bacterium]|nr:hypothetical protein [bacterium]